MNIGKFEGKVLVVVLLIMALVAWVVIHGMPVFLDKMLKWYFG